MIISVIFIDVCFVEDWSGAEVGFDETGC